MVRGKEITKTDFLNKIKEIEIAGISIKQDMSCAHFPLFEIDDNSPEKLQIGYCYLPRTHTIIKRTNKRRGISVTITLHKGSCRFTYNIAKKLHEILSDADWYFDDDGVPFKHPLEHIKTYIKESKTVLKRTK